MTTEELTSILEHCNRLAYDRDDLDRQVEMLNEMIAGKVRAHAKCSAQIVQALAEIEPILSRLKSTDVIQLGMYVYWQGEDGPCQCRMRSVGSLAALLAETEREHRERLDDDEDAITDEQIDEAALLAAVEDVAAEANGDRVLLRCDKCGVTGWRTRTLANRMLGTHHNCGGVYHLAETARKEEA